MSFPLMVRAIRLALEGVDVKLDRPQEHWGRALARFLYYHVTADLTGNYCWYVLAFARSLGEFGATITFVSNIPGETRTIPSAMYTLIQTPGGESGAARLCIISIALAMISLLISEWLARISRERRGANHAELNFSQTLGNHCLTINETLPPMASLLSLASPVPEKLR